MSEPVREPDHGPSQDGPLKYAPKKARPPGADPNPARTPPRGDVATQSPASEPAEPSWRRSRQRSVFSGDVAIAELRTRLALAPERLPDPPTPRPTRLKSSLVGRLAGVAMVTVVGLIGYRLGSAPPASPPQPAPPSSPSSQQRLASERSVAYPPQSAGPPSAAPAAATAMLQSNEQKSPAAASSRVASRQPAVGAVRPQRADEAASLTVSAGDAGAHVGVGPTKSQSSPHGAGEIALMMKSGAELMANGDIGGARLMYQRLAEEGEAVAAFALAETYDPLVLGKLNITGGITPDVALAQAWYEKAKELGSTAAPERLERLARLPE